MPILCLTVGARRESHPGVCQDARMLTVRPMNGTEFTAWRHEAIKEYAAMQVASGVWGEDTALERATTETDKGLPQGLATKDELLLIGYDGDLQVGTLWISLDPPRDTPGAAFLYDIKVDDEQQGKGYGRALLAAAEDAARARGLTSLVLSVHGGNARAIRLYETSGYTVMTQRMKKQL
jgi:ribosomal protein S18 acetylase RimI-like enzyme